MAWLNNSTGKCQIRLTELVQRKLSESGQDMEDSGVHLEESPTNFGFESKGVIMTYPPCAMHHLHHHHHHHHPQGVSTSHTQTTSSSSSTSSSSEWSSVVTIIRSTERDTRLCEQNEEEEVDDDDEAEAEVAERSGSHDSLVRPSSHTSKKTRVTMTSLTVDYRSDGGGATIGCHGDGGTTIGCHGDGATVVGYRGDGGATIGCHGDGGTTIGCHGDGVTLAPPRLKQSLSASEGVNLLAGSEVKGGGGGGGRTAEEPQRRVGVYLSAPEATAVRDCKDRVVGVQSAGQGQGQGQGGGMTKLQRFFEPLRRSRSTGNTKDETTTTTRIKDEQPQHPVSAGIGSYFFRSSSRKDDRLSADTGNGSMESEFDHDSDDRTDRSKTRNRTTEVKERFSIFLRHHSDSTQPFKEGGRREKVTLEAVLSWAKSFENLLADKNGLHWFREFLKSEFSEENIEFWIACEDYKHLKPHKMAAQAQKIFTQFVIQQAPREINIDSRTRELTCENVRHPEASTFEAAQKRIESLMGKDSYPRFIESDLYLHLLSGLRS